MRLHRNVAVVILLVLVACGKSLPDLQGIDLDRWKDDKNGCQGHRIVMEPALTSELTKLKGLAEMDIIHLLGRPDQNELYKRNQKFYFYFIHAGPPCPQADSTQKRLSICFNAMGFAKEVAIEDIN